MREWVSWILLDHADQVEIALRLCVAAISGMAVGLNRDIHNKPIGMRTLGLVALGAAIVILSGSVYEGLHFGQDAVSRVVQGILTGLGFLGAGAIIRGKDGTDVQGLTTASTVWIAAALGVTAGRRDPSRRGSGPPLNVRAVLAPDDGSGSEKTQAGQNALHHTADGVLTEMQTLIDRARKNDDGGAERHETQRPHADGLVVDVPVEPDRHACNCRHA